MYSNGIRNACGVDRIIMINKVAGDMAVNILWGHDIYILLPTSDLDFWLQIPDGL
jgi:hypothetical protein